MTNNTDKQLKDISTELKNIRKVLERMAQAPIFSKEDKNICIDDVPYKISVTDSSQE